MPMAIRILDMFCGMSAFRTAAEQLGGFSFVGYCDNDPTAVAAYRTLYQTEGEYFCDDARAVKHICVQTVKKVQSQRETLTSFVGAGYIRPEAHYVITIFLVWRRITGRRGRLPLQTQIEVFRQAEHICVEITQIYFRG